MNKKANSTSNYQLNEDEIIKGCIDNDVHFQKILYERFAPKMMGVSLRYCNSKMEAEDVLQDAFIKIFDKIGTFRKQGSFEGWIRKIVVYTALKSNDKRVKKFEPGDIENVKEQSFDATAISKIETKDLLKILQQLPEGYKTVFNLYAVEGYSHKEIGKMLKISEVTSRTQYSRAKQHLIKLLTKYGITRQ
ncbi:MAG: sigma-70 family RNA polymerase sigma factor [Bacteroidia bacterium]|nr:sigma-70 family RNA polymerase sigma factor [Bacteroidia bacterium]